jgi:hypothetical protein
MYGYDIGLMYCRSSIFIKQGLVRCLYNSTAFPAFPVPLTRGKSEPVLVDCSVKHWSKSGAGRVICEAIRDYKELHLCERLSNTKLFKDRTDKSSHGHGVNILMGKTVDMINSVIADGDISEFLDSGECSCHNVKFLECKVHWGTRIYRTCLVLIQGLSMSSQHSSAHCLNSTLHTCFMPSAACNI